MKEAFRGEEWRTFSATSNVNVYESENVRYDHGYIAATAYFFRNIAENH